LKTVPQPW